MILWIDESTLDMQVKIGPLEKYEVTEEIKEAFERSKKIKELRDTFINEAYNPEVKKLLDLVDKINKNANESLKSSEK
jgi:hypothetical protein